MSNTVYGPYTPTVWAFQATTGTYTRMNNLESQAGIALHGFNSDLLTPFVFTGMTASKDGTTVNQLDVTAGRAYLTMTDGTLGQVVTSASTSGQFTTATASTTYYLDLNPDGTWSWGTAHSAESNYLAIAQVTTDASGNISTVSDERSLASTLLSGMAGSFNLPQLASLSVYAWSTLDNGNITTDGSGNIGFGISPTLTSKQSGGSATGFTWKTWNGSASVTPFSVGGQFNSALLYVDSSGNLNGGTATGLPTNRGGTATLAEIYTSTSTPVGDGVTTPRTGAIWAKA